MSTLCDASAFDRGIDPILGFFTHDQAEALVAFRGDDKIRARVEELAQQNTEGTITPAELAEYEGYVQANKFIAVLQAKARKILTPS
jgi:hypothetical protein